MINIRTNQGGTVARHLAEKRNNGKAVHISSIFYVRGPDGKRTDECDYVFTTTQVRS